MLKNATIAAQEGATAVKTAVAEAVSSLTVLCTLHWAISTSAYEIYQYFEVFSVIILRSSSDLCSQCLKSCMPWLGLCSVNSEKGVFSHDTLC